MLDFHENDPRRLEILEAAKRVFQTWGLKKTTMEDIANEAGKGKSTLYYYFNSKEQIIDVILELEYKKIIDHARESALNASTAKEMLKRYIVQSIIAMKREIQSYTRIWDDIKRDQKLITKLRDRFQHVEEQLILDILNIGVNKNEFSFLSEDEIATAAKAITGMIHALELYLLLENDDIDQVDIAARLITNGV